LLIVARYGWGWILIFFSHVLLLSVRNRACSG
jgi:hypothetical protein